MSKKDVFKLLSKFGWNRKMIEELNKIRKNYGYPSLWKEKI
jgi:hypothetical protein